MDHNLPTDVKCPKCGRWAAQHTSASFDLCPKTENEILRVEIGKLQRSVMTLFSLRDPDLREELH